jgi:hypothetical protein
MIEPSIALKTAIREKLIADTNVTALVNANSIRTGSSQPDKMPSIIMGHSQTINLGRSGDQYLTRVYVDIHIWAIEDGAEKAQAIGAAVVNALWDAPIPVEADIDAYTRPSFQWISDPQPEQSYTHGVASIEAVVRWSV